MSLTSQPRSIAPFYAMEMAREASRRAAAGARIVRFDVGQPAWGAPPAALAAASAAMGDHALGYTDALGDMRLRKALSDWYDRVHGVSVSPDRIVITTGASGGFQLAFLALLSHDARVLMARPGYPPYRQILAALGFSALELEASPADGLQLTAEMVAGGPDASAALIASPANPTGAMLSRASLKALADACRARGMTLISDEIYHGLAHDAPAVTALTLDPDAIVVNSFSKYWAMTGWRVGWLVAPERLIAPIERLAQNLTICPPAISQIAALAALSDDATCQARANAMRLNRDRLVDALPALGLTPVVRPDGAFYVLLDVSNHTDDSFAFCHRALDEAGVALTPGRDFDPARGDGWVRLSYARGAEDIDEGLTRLEAWLRR